MAERETLTAIKKKKAKALLDNQRFQEARDIYVSICQTNTQDYDSFVQLAALSIRLGLLGDAEAAYKHVSSLRPDDPKPFLDLGLLVQKSWPDCRCRPMAAALDAAGNRRRIGIQTPRH